MALTTRKQLFSTLLLLSLSSELCALTFNTEGCGETKGCYASPASCTTSENCDFLVTYNATNSTHVEFELSGKGDWMAVGFSDDQLMANTDILMCVNNQSLSGHYYATGQSIPPRTNPTPAAVEIIEQADQNNIIKCRISREVNPVPAIANFTDLNQEVFLLAAYGNVDGSVLRQHLRRDASPVKVRVTQANSTVTNGSQVNPSTEAPAMQQGSFRFPDNCPDVNCDFLVTYQASGDDSVVFELRGRGEWAGVGFSEDNQMPDTDILICSSDTSLSGHYYATSRTRPTRTNPTPSAVDISEQSFVGGVMSCRITRELNLGITNSKNLELPQFLLGAFGGLSGTTLLNHGTINRRASASKIDVRSGGDADSDDAIKTNVLAHGIMMTLAWILFAFVGLFTARYMREVWEPRKLLGEKAWFTVHRSLMTITLLLTIAATILIFVHVKGWSSGAGPHPYLGIVAIALAIVQPIMAAFRPHPGAPRRNIFNWSHRIVGTIALVMAVVSIYYGLRAVGLGDQGLWAVITFYIGEFLIFVFEAYLILSKRNKEKNSVSMGNTRDIPMEAPGHQTQPQTEMSMKEAMIRSFMFVFVTLLGASVALTIILLLVLK